MHIKWLSPRFKTLTNAGTDPGEDHASCIVRSESFLLAHRVLSTFWVVAGSALQCTGAAMAQACTMASRVCISCAHFSGLRKVEAGAASTGMTFANLQQRTTSLEGKGHRGVVAMAGTGKFFVGGNWKCNGTQESIVKLVSELNDAKLEDDVDVIVAPPALYIDYVVKSLAPRIEVSAQNAWVGKGGAFTGEVSADQVKDIGCKWLITGHSERRHVIGKKFTQEIIGFLAWVLEDNESNISMRELISQRFRIVHTECSRLSGEQGKREGKIWMLL